MIRVSASGSEWGKSARVELDVDGWQVAARVFMPVLLEEATVRTDRRHLVTPAVHTPLIEL